MARRLNIVQWGTIDDEPLDEYLSMVGFARNLERALSMPEAWPKVVLTDHELRQLESRLSEICPALRNEAFLPRWDYSADHKLPLIPEPLGLVSLGHSERRVDPVASMGLAAGIVVVSLLVFALIIAAPPWVPGS